MYQLSKSCYCKASLRQYTWNQTNPITCRNCARPILKNARFYGCPNSRSQCVYRQLCTQSFLHCSECYESSENDENAQSTAIDFIYNKFRHSLNTISLVYI